MYTHYSTSHSLINLLCTDDYDDLKELLPIYQEETI